MKKRDLFAVSALALVGTFALAQAGETGAQPTQAQPEPRAQAAASAEPARAPEEQRPETQRAVRVVYPAPYAAPQR